MKLVIVCISLILGFASSNPFNEIDSNDDRNVRLPVMYDPYWPTDCYVPDCEEAQRAVKYPTPLARQYYQCAFDGARWIPQIVPCPCDLIFSYKDQQCVYPWNIQKWCENDYIKDILPINCA